MRFQDRVEKTAGPARKPTYIAATRFQLGHAGVLADKSVCRIPQVGDKVQDVFVSIRRRGSNGLTT